MSPLHKKKKTDELIPLQRCELHLLEEHIRDTPRQGAAPCTRSKSMYYGRRRAGGVRAGRERKEERDESRRLANRRRKAGVYDVLGSTNTSLTLRLAADHVKSTVVLNDASGGE